MLDGKLQHHQAKKIVSAQAVGVTTKVSLGHLIGMERPKQQLAMRHVRRVLKNKVFPFMQVRRATYLLSPVYGF
jgi:hypothetical protein